MGDSAAMIGQALRRAFAQPAALGLLLAVPLAAVIVLLAAQRRKRALRAWAGGTMPERPAAGTPLAWWRASCAIVGAAGASLLVLGIAGPQWGPDQHPETAPGRDVVVVLDMSRSMLAQDVIGTTSPNRLGRARDALMDLADDIRARGGHRLGIVVFAARAAMVCPLTHDYDHVREALARLDAEDASFNLGPERGRSPSGTRIGEGIRQAVALHDSRSRGHQDIILISDGDDPANDREWEDGAAVARAAGIPVHTVGVGAEAPGSPIPLPGGGVLRHDGRIVLTRLVEEPLREIARQTGGVYLPARTRALPLGTLFRDRIDSRAGREEPALGFATPRPRYPWFFGAALALLGLYLAFRSAAGGVREALHDAVAAGDTSEGHA